MKEKEIISSLKNIFSSIENATTIASYEFQEERTENMIVIGITNTTQANVGLPDYKYELEIVIDSWISDDNTGEEFNRISNEAKEVLLPYIIGKNINYTDVFGNIPIVGILYNGSDFSITTESNRTVLRYSLFASFPI